MIHGHRGETAKETGWTEHPTLYIDTRAELHLLRQKKMILQ